MIQVQQAATSTLGIYLKLFANSAILLAKKPPYFKGVFRGLDIEAKVRESKLESSKVQ